MTFLLDTHILIRAADGTLPQEAVPVITGTDTVLLFPHYENTIRLIAK